MIAGLGTLLLHTGPGLVHRLIGGDIDAPHCSAVMNRWANQRLKAAKAQLEEDHALYRSDGKALNAISTTMNWIDDRIIDQRMAEQRRKLNASVLHSAGCLPRFTD